MTNRGIERAVLGGLLFYVILLHGLSAYLAHSLANPPFPAALPKCLMRSLLGIPCPLCFGTTTMILIWRGYWGAALRLDPFVFALFWLSVLIVPALGFLLVSRQVAVHWLGAIPRRIWRALAIAFALALVGNWLYLIATLSGTSPEEILGKFP